MSIYAERMGQAVPSFIRESLKLSADPSIISFAGGNPDAGYFPVEPVADSCRRVLEEDGEAVLQYAVTEGYPGLRRRILARMEAMGIHGDLENVAITSGSQQGLDLTGKVFLDQGDEVIVESPSYMGAINAFRFYQPQFVEVDMDEDGMQMDALEARLKECRRAKFIYTIPDFQNPTGRTMSAARRKRLVELAEQYNVMVVEDSPYYDLRFEGKKVPPVKSFDTGGRVIYLGSFSKVLCPALRVGWVFGEKDAVSQYVVLKQAADLHSNQLAQRIVADYIDNEDLDLHIAKINQAYKEKRDCMLHKIDSAFPKGITRTSPEGGLFIWLTLPEELDAHAIFQRALKEEKVCFVPGDTFYPYGGHKNTLRLSFATVSLEQIEEGMDRLARALGKF